MNIDKLFLGKAYFNFFNGAYTGFAGFLTEDILSNVQNTRDTIAISCLDINNCSNYLVFDIDGNKDNLDACKYVGEKLSQTLKQHNLHTSIIFSGNKGYHVYVFFDAPINAFSLRMVGEYILSKLDLPNNVVVEIFPKQNTADYNSKSFGSHLRYPLSKNPKTNVISNFSSVNINAAEDFSNLELFVLNKDIINTIINQLTIYFTPGKRHHLMLGLAGYFKNNSYPVSMPLYILGELHKVIKDLDINDLKRVITDTYAPDKEKIAGFSLLKSILPYNVIKLFDLLIYDATNIKSIVHQIRSAKGQSFNKIEECANLLTNYISENYHLYTDGFLYVVDKNCMYTDANDSLIKLLHTYGISASDAFENSVYKKLVFNLYQKSSTIKLNNYQAYTPNKELLVFNSEATYTISDRVYKSNVVYPSFNYKNFSYVPNDKRKTNIRKFFHSFGLDEDQVDTLYTYLVFSFLVTDEIVKPILIFQGLPGSGKTTLASILLKLIENINSSVTTTITKEDDFKAMLPSRRCIVLDNMEAVPAWFFDLANSLCTGGEINQRKLYSNNVIIKIKPTTLLILTSAYADYEDRAFNERSIKILLHKRNEFKSLQNLMFDFFNGYDSIVSELMDTVIDIKNVIVDDYYTSRMTDFIRIRRQLIVKKYLRSKEEIVDDTLPENIQELLELMILSGLNKNTSFYMKEYFIKIKYKYEKVIGKNYTLKMFGNDLIRSGKFERNTNGSFRYV